MPGTEQLEERIVERHERMHEKIQERRQERAVRKRGDIYYFTPSESEDEK